MRTNNLHAIETAFVGSLLPMAFACGRHNYGRIIVLNLAMYGPGGRCKEEVRKVYSDFICGCHSGKKDECQPVDVVHEEFQKRATATGTEWQKTRSSGVRGAAPLPRCASPIA